MREFDCLSEEQSLDGHFFLEASAGTGKTFAIENIVARILADPQKEISIDEILIVTFTRAATRDMRGRILANLEQYNPPLVEAIAHFDEAQIYTIHGFCHAMLQEYALEAGVTVSTEEAEDQSYLSLVEETITDFFRTKVELPKYHPMQLAHLLRGSQGSFSHLVKSIRAVALSQKNIDVVRDWEELSALMPKSVSEQIADEFFAIAPLFKGLCNVQKSPHQKYLQQIDLLIEGNPELLLEDDLFFQYLERDNLKKNAEFPNGELIALAEIILPLWKEASSFDAIFGRVIDDCRPLIAKKMSESEMISPDLLLEKMAASLHIDAFFEIVSNRFKVAIIDEFQDTDHLQWKIFKTLFHRPDKSLFLVGDPKQSIYAFRGADIATYLQARSDVGESNCYSLGTNYRSEPKLVTSLNTLFSAGNSWMGEISYLPVKANPKAVDEKTCDEKANLHFLIHESSGGRSVPSAEEENVFLFPYIAAEIQKLKTPLSDIAILIKDRYQAIRLQTFLHGKGIPSQAKGAVHIASTKMFRVMEKFLITLFDSSDTGMIKQVLSSPIARYSHWDLRYSLDAELEAFKELAEIMEKHGFAATFSRLLETSFKGKKALHHLTNALELTDYTDFMQVGELLIERSISKIDRVEDLLDYMQEIAKEEIEERHELKRRLVLQGEAVQIMTTHMSKGLEFSVVFALGMGCRSPHEDNSQEKMRQFYVALTRAKKRVYLPYIHCPKQGNAPIEAFLTYMFGTHSSLSLLEEKLGAFGFTYEYLQAIEVDVESAQKSATIPQKRAIPILPEKTMLSFSSLTAGHAQGEKKEVDENALPLGAHTGTIFHNILEKLIDRGIYCHQEKMRQYIKATVLGTTLAPYCEEITALIEKAFTVDLGGFSLEDVPPQKMLTESEFRFSQKKNLVIKGFADLVFQFDGKYYLIDWKTNFLGRQKEDYDLVSLEQEMHLREYNLQGTIYSSALKKYLKIIESRPYEEVFGGAKYIFIRGIKWDGFGVYSFFPKIAAISIKEGV